MKKTLALLFAFAALTSAQAETSVGVSIGINQPGVYGRINIGDVPRPALVYPQPVIIQSSPVAVAQQPIYMHVPPGHYKRWSRYCGRYGACGQPVYFVQDAPRPVVTHDRDERHGDRHDRRGDHRR